MKTRQESIRKGLKAAGIPARVLPPNQDGMIVVVTPGGFNDYFAAFALVGNAPDVYVTSKPPAKGSRLAAKGSA